MLYLEEKDLQDYQWCDLIDQIDQTIKSDYVQPIKPYLRFHDPKNRIIAMPAYVGGKIDIAGIKWISSFPNNFEYGLPRAHCIVILNDSKTGMPICCINSPLISVLRTSAVTGWMITKLKKLTGKIPKSVGIIGYGPIGQFHVRMMKYLFPNIEVKVFDINPDKRNNTETWQDAFKCDVVITSTVSDERYIDIPAKKGQWIMNISLRDFRIEKTILKSFDCVIVDNWDEINRENTDIEKFNEIDNSLTETHHTIFNLPNTINKQSTIFFNPMGMGIFDLSIAKYFYDQK